MKKAGLVTDQDAIDTLHLVWERLRELGWSDSIYFPKDGSVFETISMGSTGVHRCTYWGKWPDGYFMVQDGVEVHACRAGSGPIMWRPVKE